MEVAPSLTARGYNQLKARIAPELEIEDSSVDETGNFIAFLLITDYF